MNMIPVEYYSQFYVWSAGIFYLGILLHSYTQRLDSPKNKNFLLISGIILFLSLSLYIGLRPNSRQYFGDMATYAIYYKNYAIGAPVTVPYDLVFHYFLKGLSYFVSLKAFFVITVILYIYPMFRISKFYFKQYWYYGFFVLVVSFSFWPYITNGIRNGIATSLFLWGLSYNRYSWKILFFTLAVLFHKSLALPVIAYILSSTYNKPKIYLYLWISSIPLSLISSGFWINLFTKFGFGDDRLNAYLSSTAENSTFTHTGFRWDFLIYSSIPVIIGAYYILYKKFKDRNYALIFNIYLICNSFWILVITANFSNRFAYLSWFMMGIVTIYPFIQAHSDQHKHRLISNVTGGYYLFTLFMNIIYYG